MDIKIRAVAYCRVSSMDQVVGVLTVKGSLEEQEEKARTYAKAQGWNYIKTYIEPGLSGEKFEERVALQTMLEDARDGQIDIVIVKAGDRLARDQEVFFRITKILNQFYNVQILNMANPSPIVAPQNFNGRRNPMLIVQQGVDAMMAAFDQARRTDMLIEGRRRQARAGRFIFSSICYGYTIDRRIVGERKVERVPVPDQMTYWVIEMLPDFVLKEHLSDREIARRLTRLGAKPSKGDIWHSNTVGLLLKNPFYGGKIAYGKKAWRVDETGKTHYFPNPDEEKIILAAHRYEHPWTWETYLAIQEERKGRSSEAPRTRVSRSPLAGLLKCGYCGSSMLFNPSNRKGRIIERKTRPDGTIEKIYDKGTICPPFYICATHERNTDACQRNSVHTSVVLTAIQSYLDELLELEKNDPEEFYKTLRQAGTQDRRSGLSGQITETKRRLKERIPAQVERLNKAFLNGAVTEEQYPELTRTINEEKAKLENNLAVLEDELNRLDAANFQEKQFNRFLRVFESNRELFNRNINEWTQVEVRTVKTWLAGYFDRIEVKIERKFKARYGKVDVSFFPKPLI